VLSYRRISAIFPDELDCTIYSTFNLIYRKKFLNLKS